MPSPLRKCRNSRLTFECYVIKCALIGTKATEIRRRQDTKQANRKLKRKAWVEIHTITDRHHFFIFSLFSHHVSRNKQNQSQFRRSRGFCHPLDGATCNRGDLWREGAHLDLGLHSPISYQDFYHMCRLLFLVFYSVSGRIELCRRTQQPSLTFHLVGGSTFGLWPLFHLRDGGKMDWNDCHTAWGNLTLISSLHYYKNHAWFFSLIVFFTFYCCYFFLCDLVSPSTGCKWQLFER
jgi:hypothetical protein